MNQLIIFYIIFIQNYYFPDHRIETIKFTQIYELNTIIKLVERRYVMVSSAQAIGNQIDYYKGYGLIVTGHEFQAHYYSFVLRKHMNTNIRNKLIKL